MSTNKKHKKNKREIKTRKSIINMNENEQTTPTETTETNHVEAVINQTELSEKEEILNKSTEQSQTDQDAAMAVNVLPQSETAAPESEILTEPEPVSIPVPIPTHTETTENEQAKKLYEFYFGKEPSTTQAQETTPMEIIHPTPEIIEPTPEIVEPTQEDNDFFLDEIADHLKQNVQNFKTFLPNPELLKPQQNREVPPPKKFNPWAVGAIVGILIALVCLCFLIFGNREKV